ncbi:MAG: ATP-binding protein [Thermomicrobiales bacterium]|nr:ATP-binding protein [Thermomicrobiales bacterium]
MGRLSELAAFRAALTSNEPPYVVFHVHGPGGVGKTALLREFARIGDECGRSVVHLDGRNVDPTPVGLLLAIRQELGQDIDQDPAAWPLAGVLLIDTYETLTSLDTWLRETLLPQLPMQWLVVLAGRDAPATAWRADPGWAALTRIVPLRNLHPQEGRSYLALHGIPTERHDQVLAATHGHPLAMTLVANAMVQGDGLAAGKLQSSPDVVRILLERLVQEAPNSEHRRALEVAVLAWATTESLLAETLQTNDAHALFVWLRGLPIMEHGPHGIFPHDLVREVLDADFRWRDPAGYRQLSERLAACLHGRFQQSRGVEQQRVWFDLLYLTRNSPAIAPYFDWSSLGDSYAEVASPADHPAIVAMVRRHQGDASARIAEHWLRRLPQAFLVFRGSGGELFGFMAHLPLDTADADDVAVDPAIASAMEFARRHGPMRSGEELLYLRYWMHRDLYQQVSPAINLTAISCSIHWTTRPRLAWNFLALADPDFFEPHFTGIHMWRSPDADFEVGGRHYGVFAHDWRIEPPTVWLNIKAELRGDAPAMGSPNGSPAPSLLVLSETAFADAVRQALRDDARPERIAANPLMHSRLVIDVAGQGATPEALRTVLRQAAATLTGTPRDLKLHRAVWHTYFEPAATQEAAAELLGLPFNTYRYRLAKGIERITNWLWQRELNGPGA